MRRFIAIAASVTMAGSAHAESCASSDRPAIVMNQLGMLEGLPSTAILRTDAPEPVPVRIFDGDGDVILRTKSTVFGPNESSGNNVHQIHVAPLPAGEGYRIEACGETSEVFRVTDDLYGGLAHAALNYFYANRLGEPIDEERVPGPQWARAAGFPDETVTCFTGEDQEGQEWPGCSYALDVTGGWADAGDYGKYVVNGGLSVWTLQHAAESLVAFDLGGPEAETVAAIRNETRYGLEFLMAMQVPPGETVTVPRDRPDGQGRLVLSEIAAGGMAHHKVHERAWLPLPLRPAEAQAERYLFPPSTAATLNLAAAAAQGARLWREADPDFSARALKAARRAYDAARRHPDILAYDNFSGGGAYGDTKLSDEFAWAATELWLTTGEERYLEEIGGETSHTEYLRADPGDLAWPEVRPAVHLSLLLHRTRLTDGELQALEAGLRKAADRYLGDREREGYRFPMSLDAYEWGSNGNAANRGIILFAAHEVIGDDTYLEAAADVLDYLLGRNALAVSYIAGFGERAMRTPHHRFWARGADPDFPEALPGALSGGPNANLGQDPFSNSLAPCAPQRCWADEVEAYSLNETAINWNAPAFWLAALLQAKQDNQ